ncbi:DNA-3-methyladenine glycosylase [uncultured Corynebacterium sp.]|uniref:DNA-3-methyladenine glycosylase n=1 Tax=uncultured Corynebacterium sp. TaxID=159447 RepID=UPI0025D33A54|nr:DNA-3-methyladenine glycosylase [uncultured Corynebacterium sp.]
MIDPIDSPAAITRAHLCRHPAEAAETLLGRVLAVPGEGLRARITEVEAYGGPADSPWPDPGAHTWPGPTPRNRVMFGPAGHLYVYRSYGIHFCANITAGPEGVGGGVLLRAAAILDGEDAAVRRRTAGRGPAQGESGDTTSEGGGGVKRDVVKHSLARGPGNLGQALGIDLDDYGLDLFDPASRVRLEEQSVGADAATVRRGPRVGLRGASDRPWRLWIDGEPSVSAYRRHPKADGAA